MEYRIVNAACLTRVMVTRQMKEQDFVQAPRATLRHRWDSDVTEWIPNC